MEPRVALGCRVAKKARVKKNSYVVLIVHILLVCAYVVRPVFNIADQRHGFQKTDYWRPMGLGQPRS